MRVRLAASPFRIARLAITSRIALVVASSLAATIAFAAPVTLKTTEFGSGPTIVLVHSIGSGRLYWMPTARKLLGNWHVVMVDLPGHGDSPLPDPFSLEASAEALDRVVAAHPADSTVIVGQGVGGLLALMSASAHPDHQRALVLIDAALKSPLPIDEQQKKQFVDFMDQNYDTFFTMIFSRMGRDSLQNVAIRASAAQVPPNTIKAYMRALLNVDGTRAVKDLRTPMLFVATERILPPEKDWATVGKQLGWEDPVGVTPRRLAKCGALIASEQPDSLAMIVSEFAKGALAKKQ
ncbi:MAG: alpha/beta fold hydrolase [Candidatus Eisenbacteria bacterium]|nr:alpha/beta fold hydrolase [Candidatus Eisenbacteria bacterium]